MGESILTMNSRNSAWWFSALTNNSRRRTLSALPCTLSSARTTK